MKKEFENENKYSKINNEEYDEAFFINLLKSNGFEIISSKPDYNFDVYYDTEDLSFLHHNKSVRIRSKNDKLIAYYKNALAKNNGSTSRNEYKTVVKNYNISELIESFKVIDHLIRNLDPEPKLIIKNNRHTITVLKDDITVKFSIDDLYYVDPLTEKSVKDSGIEAETNIQNKKSEKVLRDIDKLIYNIGSYEQERYENKYKKGMTILNQTKKVLKK